MGFVDSNMEVDINRLRVTDLPYNPRVAMPGGLEDGEVELHLFKKDAVKVVETLRSKTKKWSNLEEAATRGLKKIQERVKRKELVCFTTDKSGRWSCDTPDNYRRACRAELADERRTPMISHEDHSEAEKELNCHALALLRLMGLDEGSPGDRLRQAVVTHGVQIPPFYGMRKDHKQLVEGMEEVGPKARPVCGAEDCMTKRLSYLVCMLLGNLIKGNHTHCESTEDLLEAMEEMNQNGNVSEHCIVGSLDVEALYPSLDVRRCAEAVSQKMFESDLVFPGLVWKEIALYLTYHLSRDQIQMEGIQAFCPTRRHKKGKPTFTASGSSKKVMIRHGPWIFPQRGPNLMMTRKMFCLAIRVMVEKAMSLHDFHFDGQVYRQSGGGSIGLDLTGVISDIYMCVWDEKLKSLAERDGAVVMLYKRYKDDINVVLDPSGMEIESVGADRSDRVVMERLKTLANTIDPCLKVTTDCCSNHEDRKVPILDVRVWIDKTSEDEWFILHSHYMKEVASRVVMHEKSSHGERMRFNVLVNEVDRILRNCSPRIEWNEEVVPHVSYFMKRMAYSGYSKRMRYEVLRKAFKRYDARMRRYRQGQSFYKSDNTDRSEKRGKKDWYKEGGKYESVIFVEATPKSVLKERMERVIAKHKLKMRVIERVGTTIKRLLQKSDPFMKSVCDRNDCVLCQKGSKVNCRDRGCVYELECIECQRRYRGQTSRSMYERTREHMNDWTQGDDRCPLVRHSVLYHSSDDFEFNIRVIGKCYGKPSRRLITEAVMIDELSDDETMNNKKEWSYVVLNKIGV